MLEIVSAGLQATLQGAPRRGYRHMGIPWAGPADAWSMALANRLVGNAPGATAIEVTLGGFEVLFHIDVWFALAGAETDSSLNGEQVRFHQTCRAQAGQTLKLLHPDAGMRTYLAIAGGIMCAPVLGATSTYLPAGLGGHEGRALRRGDELAVEDQPADLPILNTPQELRPAQSRAYALRACESGETGLLSQGAQRSLFETEFTIGRQATRMGVSLEGTKLALNSDGKMKSAAVFPGTIQCPEDGAPIILLADAQTTGGYPRIASIARCDRHMLGQLRPGDNVRLLRRTREEAVKDLQAKLALLRSWVPDFSV